MSDPHGTQWFDLPLPDLTAAQRQQLHQALQGEGIPASWGGSTVRVDTAYEARLTTLVAQVRAGAAPPPPQAPPPPGAAPPPYAPPPGVAATAAPYGAPPVGAYEGSPTRTNSMAIVSLVLGIASLVVCQLTAPFGVWTGIKARKEIRESGEQGDGMALAGIITSAIGLGILVLAVIIVAIVIIAAAASSN